jgi:hypothetical protein
VIRRPSLQWRHSSRSSGTSTGRMSRRVAVAAGRGGERMHRGAHGSAPPSAFWRRARCPVPSGARCARRSIRRSCSPTSRYLRPIDGGRGFTAVGRGAYQQPHARSASTPSDGSAEVCRPPRASSERDYVPGARAGPSSSPALRPPRVQQGEVRNGADDNACRGAAGPASVPGAPPRQ